MITPCLRRLRHNLLIGSIAVTAAFLLIDVLAVIRDDLRPTILSNAALVATAASWITVALLAVGVTLAARIDKLRLARDVEASRRTPERPERLRLVAPPAPQPDRRPRLRLFTSAAPVLLLVTVAVLVGLGMMTPPNAAGGSGGPVAQHEPTVRAATDTVTVAADAAHTADPSSAAAPQAPAPSTGTTMPTSCATPPPSASSTPVTTAPSTTKTKHKKPAPTTGSTSSTAPTGSTQTDASGSRHDQSSNR